MLPTGLKDLFLVAERQTGQVMSDRRTQATVGHRFRCLWGQLCGQGQTSHDPFLFSSQKFGDCRGRKPILGDQGFDHQTLAQGSERAFRRIGLQEHLFMCGGQAATFDDDGNVCATIQMPAFQAFESINDFEPILADGDDSDWQGAQLLRSPREHPRPEAFIRGLNLFKGNKEDLGSGRFNRTPTCGMDDSYGHFGTSLLRKRRIPPQEELEHGQIGNWPWNNLSGQFKPGKKPLLVTSFQKPQANAKRKNWE